MALDRRSILRASLVLAGAGLFGLRVPRGGTATLAPSIASSPMLASMLRTSASAQIASVHPVPGTRAGSGLVRYRERLLLVQDDAYSVAWLDPHARPVQARFVALGQDSGPLPKPQKPDFEAAALLPDERVLVLGSGSTPARRSFLLLDPRTEAFAVLDAGQVYESSIPKFDDWRFGLGIGGRFYTNFGPVRLDIATPLNRRAGESKISVYVSIGQAF